MTDHEIINDDASSPTGWNTIVLERPISYVDAVKFAEEMINFHEREFDPAWNTNLEPKIDNANNQTISFTLRTQFIGFDDVKLHEAAWDALFLDQPIEGQVKTYLMKLLREKSFSQRVQGMKGRRPLHLQARNYEWTIFRTTNFLEQVGWNKSENEATYSSTSAFHAIAEAMRNLSLRPQSNTSVRDTYYRFAKKWPNKRNDL